MSMQYLSNKVWVPDTIQRVLGNTYKTFDDAMCGSCLVSHGMKKQGYQVRCNDYYYPAFCMAEGLIATPYTKTLERRLYELRAEFASLKGYRGGPLHTNCYNAAGYLTESAAMMLDAARQYLENKYRGDVLYFPGLVMIMNAADRLWQTLGHMTTYGLTPHKNTDVPEYHVPAILAGSGRATNADVFDCEFEGEILYLDPPYGGVKYPMYFHAWYSLCHWEQHETWGKNHIPLPCAMMKSVFDDENQTLNSIVKIIDRSPCKVAIVSMNVRNGAVEFTERLKELGHVSFVENGTKRTNFRDRSRPLGLTVERLIFVRRT